MSVEAHRSELVNLLCVLPSAASSAPCSATRHTFTGGSTHRLACTELTEAIRHCTVSAAIATIVCPATRIQYRKQSAPRRTDCKLRHSEAVSCRDSLTERIKIFERNDRGLRCKTEQKMKVTNALELSRRLEGLVVRMGKMRADLVDGTRTLW